MPPPHVLLGNRPKIAVRSVSQTDLVALFDFFLDLGYPDTEIAGMVQRAAQHKRLETAEAAVALAAAETPATSVALPLTTVPVTVIPSYEQLAAHRLLVRDADQREALRGSGQLGLVCFHSQNLVLCDSQRVTREQLFHGLHVHVGFDPYYQAGVEL